MAIYTISFIFICWQLLCSNFSVPNLTQLPGSTISEVIFVIIDRSIFKLDFHRSDGIPEAALQRCSLEKMFWKYAANLQEKTHVEVRFQ